MLMCKKLKKNWQKKIIKKKQKGKGQEKVLYFVYFAGKKLLSSTIK